MSRCFLTRRKLSRVRERAEVELRDRRDAQNNGWTRRGGNDVSPTSVASRRERGDVPSYRIHPDRRLAIRGDLGPFEATLAYDLEPVEEGTRLTNTADLEAHGVMKVAAPIAGGRVRQAVAANLDKLKEVLER
jgi:hypothetical protein